jgi:hypothetical protein
MSILDELKKKIASSRQEESSLQEAAPALLERLGEKVSGGWVICCRAAWASGCDLTG